MDENARLHERLREVVATGLEWRKRALALGAEDSEVVRANISSMLLR